MPAAVDFCSLATEAAARRLTDLAEVYAEVYAEPPYHWGEDHAALFVERFAGQRLQAGFTLIAACADRQFVGFGFGVTLLPATLWWQNLLTPLPATMVTEYPNRTFALVELVVRAPWRRQHLAEGIHGRLLHGRQEERATLTVLPTATAAQTAYRKWGWERVAQKRNPLPGSPIFDVLVKPLR